MTGFSNASGKILVEAMIRTIQENAAWLSQIDGAIGDGDHGINMNKGFTLCSQRLEGREWDLTEGLSVLGTVLLEEIGGAMGPLYGMFFRKMARETKNQPLITAEIFDAMLGRSVEALKALGGAQVGDKTMVDVADPAQKSFSEALARGLSFFQALDRLQAAAEAGKDSTKDLTAKVGRASRLGERSRGVLDAGSVSCWLLLRAMARAAQSLLKEDIPHAL